MTYWNGSCRVTYDPSRSSNPWKAIIGGTVRAYFGTQRGAQSYCERRCWLNAENWIQIP